MAQTPPKIRPLFLLALGLALLIGAGFFIREKLRHKPVTLAPTPSTLPTTQPATQPVVAEVKPPRSFMELVNREFPRLATTQPVEGGMNMRDWGHFLIRDPINLDRRGRLWITRPDAEPTATLLPTASQRQVNLTTERVLYAHWYYNEGGDWNVALVTPSPSGGFELVDAKQRRPIGAGDDYDWSRALTIFAQRLMVVPRGNRVSVFSTGQRLGDAFTESISPTLAGSAPVQIQFDSRGFI